MPTCSHCNTPLSKETTGGLCPRCLLTMNLESQTVPGSGSKEQLPPPTPDELAGAFPGYEIIECLGRGGMGIVYKARQKTLDRTVALKVLAGEWQGDPTFAKRFTHEARLLAKLNHPHIVTIHDFGESKGFYYLVMEFIDGANLRDVLRDGKIAPEQAIKIVPTICDALQYAHDNGIVHRDIKPENLLLDRTGTLKVADFGIASLVGSGSEIHGGTPEYMPPEKTADHRADIYALGVVLYEMLTGERPGKPWEFPSKKVQIDVRLDDVVLRALETDPEKRYQTAAEFATRIGGIEVPPHIFRHRRPSQKLPSPGNIIFPVMQAMLVAYFLSEVSTGAPHTSKRLHNATARSEASYGISSFGQRSFFASGQRFLPHIPSDHTHPRCRIFVHPYLSFLLAFHRLWKIGGRDHRIQQRHVTSRR